HPGYEGFFLAVSLVAFNEAAHDIAETPIPLSPAVAGEVAHLVETGGIPGLGDDFGISQDLRQFNLPDDRGIGHGRAVLVAAQNDGFIEAEAIDVHFCHPELQCIYDELLADGMIAVEGVAAS